MKKETETKQESREYYLRSSKVFNINGGLSHQIFLNVKEEQKINEETPIGTRVLVAKYPDFYKMYLYKYCKPGEPEFPRGGIKVWNVEYDQLQSFYYESVAIHPEHYIHKFRHMQEIDVDSLIDKSYTVRRK